MVAFGLSRLTPGDPIECGTGLLEFGEKYSVYNQDYKNQYTKIAKQKGLNLPPFYFNINSLAQPDTLHRILLKSDREHCQFLINQWGNWTGIQAWRKNQQNLVQKVEKMNDDFDRDTIIQIRRLISSLEFARDRTSISGAYSALSELTVGQKYIQDQISLAAISFNSVFLYPKPWKNLVPTFHWYGFNNQYHRWMSNMLVGDFGISCQNGLPAVRKIRKSIFWTLMLNIPSIFLAFLIAIPLGMKAGMNVGSKVDTISTNLLFILFSLPAFWVGTLLIVFFTTPEYGRYLDLFPSVGLGNLPSSAPFWDRFWESAGHLILPVFCNTYVAVAIIFRQMRSGVLNVLPQNYIQTARAKGLTELAIQRKHVFKNATFPIITLFGSVLPSAIAGSVVVEIVFNIPGMGAETIQSIFNRDWPVVYAILFLGAVLTLLGILLSDLLYAWLDPRVSFNNQSKNHE